MKTENPGKKYKQKTVLLVEDQKYNLLVLKMMLEKLGITVIPAKNGQEAVNICSENKNIDLVLMDLKMPVMDGYKAMIEIKKINPDMKIIAETAYALSEDRRKILDAGFDDYLPKPIKPEKLDELLNMYLK
jgi:CheY-like chemotaxis protein